MTGFILQVEGCHTGYVYHIFFIHPSMTPKATPHLGHCEQCCGKWECKYLLDTLTSFPLDKLQRMVLLGPKVVQFLGGFCLLFLFGTGNWTQGLKPMLYHWATAPTPFWLFEEPPYYFPESWTFWLFDNSHSSYSEMLLWIWIDLPDGSYVELSLSVCVVCGVCVCVCVCGVCVVCVVCVCVVCVWCAWCVWCGVCGVSLWCV
jgi:hypothetical protein